MLKKYPEAKSLWSVLLLTLWTWVTRDKTRGLHFLKCDAKGCPHIEFHDQLTQDHVGKPCPLCGANLLTQEDADNYPRMTK